MTQDSKLLVYRSHLDSHIEYGLLLWAMEPPILK